MPNQRTPYGYRVTIPSGQSQSDPIEFDGQQTQVAAVLIPAGFDGTQISFLAAGDASATHKPVHHRGAELVEPISVDAVNGLEDSTLVLAAVKSLVIRAGSAASPSPQAADRVLELYVAG